MLPPTETKDHQELLPVTRKDFVNIKIPNIITQIYYNKIFK